MAQLIITIPDAVAVRVMNAVTTRYGYQATLPNGTANPQTKPEFVRQWLISYLKAAVKEQEGATAAANAYNTASTDVDTNINIT
ncbi:MAG: hypothetical protein WKF91_21405 [Segetibacter sp.]